MGSPTDESRRDGPAESSQIEYAPEGFNTAVSAYLSGAGSLVQALEWGELVLQTPHMWRSLDALVAPLSQGSGPLREPELRILDVCVGLDRVDRYLKALDQAGREVELTRIRMYVANRRLDDRAVLKGLDRLIPDATRYDGSPTALGALLLSYLPDQLDEILRVIPENRDWLRWDNSRAPYFTLVRLLLTPRPPLLDAALHVAQQASAEQMGMCALRLLEADPQRFRTWAREVAGPHSRATVQGRHDVLVWLLRDDARGHLDLAYDALHSPSDALAYVGLEAIHAADPMGALPLAGEALLRGGLVGLLAARLLAAADVRVARPLLQRGVAEAKDVAVRVAALKALGAHAWEGRETYMCSLLADPMPQVRTTAAQELLRQGEAAIPLVAPFLTHQRAEVRLTTMLMLLDKGGARGRALVIAHLATEPSPMVRREVLAVLGPTPLSAPPEPAGAPGPHVTPETLAPEAVAREAEQALTRTRWRAGLYLAPEGAAGARWRTGEPVPDVVVRYLLFRQARTAGWDGAVDARVRELVARIDPDSAVGLGQAIFDVWLARDAPARESWCLPLACALGDVALHEKVFEQAWMFKWTRLPLAERALRALTLVDDEKLISKLGDIVTGINRGYHPRFVQAAGQALQGIAARRGVHEEEVLDQAATRPFWDRDDTRTSVFTYDDHASYTVQFAANLRWRIVDDAGQRLRALPQPSSYPYQSRAYATYGSYVALRRLVSVSVRTQAARLEAALVAERTWRVPAWRDIFLRHPLMRPLATNLVWAVGDPRNPGLATTFRPTDEGTLVAADGQAVEAPVAGEAVIWLVHPVQLEDASREAWSAHLARARAKPPFRQMDRLVVRVRPEECDTPAWTQYAGYLINGWTRMRRGKELGWASVSEPAGGHLLMRRRFQQPGLLYDLEAVLEVEPLTEASSYSHTADQERVVRLTFRSVATLDGPRSQRPVSPHEPGDELGQEIPLGAAPPVVFSEAALDVERIIASSRVDHAAEH